MNYKSELKLNLEVSSTEISYRLRKWAERYKFKEINIDNNLEFVYERGRHFRASCSFDVRNVPTRVKIKLEPESNEINISFHVKSFFYHAFPTDPDRINEQVELLVAYLKGLFDENLDFNKKI